jgi:hypothetical protein
MQQYAKTSSSWREARFARAFAQMSRAAAKKDVDARDKRGHGEL